MPAIFSFVLASFMAFNLCGPSHPVFVLGPPTETSVITNTANLPASASPKEMYSTMVVGKNMTSTLSPFLTPGETYFVRLHFCEAQTNTTGVRSFDVLLNGIPVVSSLDVVAKAGAEYVSAPSKTVAPAVLLSLSHPTSLSHVLARGMQAPYTVTFSAVAPFTIELLGKLGSSAMLSGIEIFQAYDPPSPPPAPLPPFMATNLTSVRANCGGPTFNQSPSIIWTGNCAALFSGIGTSSLVLPCPEAFNHLFPCICTDMHSHSCLTLCLCVCALSGIALSEPRTATSRCISKRPVQLVHHWPRPEHHT
jgi:hypothetical protein